MDLIFYEIKRISVTLGILSLCCIGISLMAGAFDYTIIFGVLFGVIMTLLLLFLLGFIVKNTVERGQKGAIRYIRVNYVLRYAIMFATLAIAWVVPYINFYCVLPMLFAPKLTYTVIGFGGVIKDMFIHKEEKNGRL